MFDQESQSKDESKSPVLEKESEEAELASESAKSAEKNDDIFTKEQLEKFKQNQDMRLGDISLLSP